jgi:hypothetical protein
MTQHQGKLVLCYNDQILHGQPKRTGDTKEISRQQKQTIRENPETNK